VQWLELLAGADIAKAEQLLELLKEADEMTAILVTGVKTLKARRDKRLSSFITDLSSLITHHSKGINSVPV